MKGPARNAGATSCLGVDGPLEEASEDGLDRSGSEIEEVVSREVIVGLRDVGREKLETGCVSPVFVPC